MEIELRIESQSPSGTKDVSRKSFKQPQVVIGRSPNADIRIENRRMSLTHAAIYEAEGKLRIKDLESTAGVLVNGVFVRSSILMPGDRIELAGENFEVTERGLIYYRNTHEEKNLKQRTEEEIKALDLSRWMRYARPTSIALALIIFFSFFARPLLTDNRGSWSSGPVAPVHRFIEHECQACHEGDFSRVPDYKCLNCHNLSAHPEGHVFEASLGLACVDCHKDHEGKEGLTVKDEQACSFCHASAEKLTEILGEEPQIAIIKDFSEHPGFKTKKLEQHLIFNHKVHADALINSQAEKTELLCQDCHRFEGDGDRLKPVKFEEHCVDCHGLDFDERFPTLQLPHESPQEVKRFLIKHYRKNPVTPERSDRQIPARDTAQTLNAEEMAASTYEFFVSEGACAFCHDMDLLENPNASSPESWLEELSSFNHRTHQAFSCVSCHRSSLESEDSSDILIPSMQTCRECHAGDSATRLTNVSCTSCHIYHKALPLSEEKRRSLEKMEWR